MNSDVVFSPIVREDTLEWFKNNCQDEFIFFNNLLCQYSELHKFFHRKNGGKHTKEYYAMVGNIRIKDNFLSSLILLSQGFVVDGLILLRSSLENQLLLYKIYTDNHYFEKWLANKSEVKAYDLRDIHIFTAEQRSFYKEVYKFISNIVHPRKDSFETTPQHHPTFKTSGTKNGESYLKLYVKLLISMYSSYFIELSTILKNYYKYTNDIDVFDKILFTIQKLDYSKILKELSFE